MTESQALHISRKARYLLTDLEQLLGVSADEGIEQRALQLITEAFEDTAPLYLGTHFTLSENTEELVNH